MISTEPGRSLGNTGISFSWLRSSSIRPVTPEASLLDNSAEESLPPLAAAAQRLDPERLLPLLRQLVDRLQSRSLAARRLVGEVDELTRGSELAGEFSEIIQAVQQLHYEAALASLEQLLDRHQWRETT